MDAPLTLREALDRSALVTVVGPHGAGKTWIAARSCPPDALRVCCVAVHDAAELERRVGLELECPVDALPPRALLLLDGLEIDASSVVASWIERGGRLLVTRATPLGLAGEQVVAVPPLPVDDAVRFVRERTPPLWASTPRQQRALAELVQHLDCRPGPLLRLTARAGLGPPSEILASARDGTVVDWGLGGAWDALSARDQQALGRLAAVDGAVPTSLAAALLGPDWEARVLGLRAGGWVDSGVDGLVLGSLERALARARCPQNVDLEVVAWARGIRSGFARVMPHLWVAAPRCMASARLALAWLLVVDRPRAQQLVEQLFPGAAPEHRTELASYGAFLCASNEDLERWSAHAGGDELCRLRFAFGQERRAWRELELRVEPLLELERAFRELAALPELVNVLHLLSATYGRMGQEEPARAARERWANLAVSSGSELAGLLARCTAALAVTEAGDFHRVDELEALVAELQRHGRVSSALAYGGAAWMARWERGDSVDRAELGDMFDEAVRIGCRHRPQIRIWLEMVRVDAGMGTPDEYVRLAESLRPSGGRFASLSMHILALVAYALRGDRALALAQLERVRALRGIPPERAILPAIEAIAEGRPYVGPPATVRWERFLVRCADRVAGPTLAVDPDGFGDVDLRRRRVLRRLWAALHDEAVTNPGGCLSAEQLVEAGWPGERISWDSARNRLHVSLSGLRKLGLGSTLQCEEAGWRLDPAVRLSPRR